MRLLFNVDKAADNIALNLESNFISQEQQIC